MARTTNTHRRLLGLTPKDLTIFCLGFALFTLGLFSYYQINPINSDDVAQKVILHQINLHEHTVLSPPDSYILKVPLNIIIDSVIHDPVTDVVATTWVMNLIGFFLFFAVSKYFLVKYGNSHSLSNTFYGAYLLMCAGNMAFLQSLASPHIRTIEIGLYFGILWFIDKHVLSYQITRPNWRKARVAILAPLFLGLFLYSDPAFLFFLLVPLFGVIALQLRQQNHNAQRTPLLLLLGASLIFYELFNLAFRTLGLYTYRVPASFVQRKDLLENLSLGLDRILSIQNAYLHDLGSQHFMLPVIVYSMLILTLAALIAPPLLLLNKRYRSLFWCVYLALQPLCIITPYLASQNVVTNPDSSRYVVLLSFAVVLLIAVCAEAIDKHVSRILFGSLVFATMLSVLGTTQQLIQSKQSNPNDYNRHLAQVISENHLQKGYATYWDAIISTYYTGYTAQVFPLVCNENEVRPFYWVVNEDQLRTMSAGRTFVVTYTPDSSHDTEAVIQRGLACTPSVTSRAFGQPDEIIDVTDRTKLFIYDTDVLRRLGPIKHTSIP